MITKENNKTKTNYKFINKKIQNKKKTKNSKNKFAKKYSNFCSSKSNSCGEIFIQKKHFCVFNLLGECWEFSLQILKMGTKCSHFIRYGIDLNIS